MSPLLFDFYVKVKVMVMGILNIVKMVKERVNITITIKYEVAYGLSINIFIYI